MIFVEILRVVPASKIMAAEAPNDKGIDHFPGNHRNEFILAIQKWKQKYELQ